MGFSRNRITLATASVHFTTYSVSDSIVPFTPAHSHWHPPHTHDPRYRIHTSSLVFLHNRTDLTTTSVSPTTYSVSDIIVAFTLAPTPHSRFIHTPTHPTSTLLTFTCTQVRWFLSCLTRSRSSGVTTRPATSLTIVPTRATQCTTLAELVEVITLTKNFPLEVLLVLHISTRLKLHIHSVACALVPPHTQFVVLRTLRRPGRQSACDFLLL